jgi:pilus assembly protein CpaB
VTGAGRVRSTNRRSLLPASVRERIGRDVTAITVAASERSYGSAMLLGSLFRRRFPVASKVFAGLAIACGLTALLLVRGMESRLAAAHPATGSPVQVVVASIDASRGSVLSVGMVRIRQIPSVFVPPGALTEGEQVVGRVLTSDVAAGEVLTRSRVSAGGAGPIAALVPPGLRAMSVVVLAAARDLRAGDHVDLLAAFGGGAPHTETVADGLEVLRVTDAGGSGGGPSLPGVAASAPGGVKTSLLLLVSPDEAQRLAFAQAFAALSVAIVPAEGDGQGPATPGETSSATGSASSGPSTPTGAP